MRVDGKVAVVTGGAGGIGAETARTLAREGAKVVIADVVEQAGQAIAREIGAKFYKHDVTNEDQWQALVGDVVAIHGKIDVLVNAAGIEGDLSQGGLDRFVRPVHCDRQGSTDSGVGLLPAAGFRDCRRPVRCWSRRTAVNDHG